MKTARIFAVSLLLYGCRNPKPEQVSASPKPEVSSAPINHPNALEKEMDLIVKQLEFRDEVAKVDHDLAITLMDCLRVDEKTFKQNNCLVRLDEGDKEIERLKKQGRILYPQEKEWK